MKPKRSKDFDSWFKVMEVLPKISGKYKVTLFRFLRDGVECSEYTRCTLNFSEGCWEYKQYGGECYVCFIHEKL